MKTSFLNSSATTLLLGCFGIAVLLAIREGKSVHRPFEMLIVGYLAIVFYENYFAILTRLGLELEVLVTDPHAQESINNFIGQSLFQSATKFDTSHPLGSTGNMLNYFAQVFRTGIWGVLASATEILFILSRFILEVSRDALWQIALVLFPLTAAVFPVNPKIMLNLLAFTLELALWLPILGIVNIATSDVARKYSTLSHDFGFYVLALEIVAILLTTTVPLIAHKFVSGALSGNIVDSWKKTLSTGMNVITAIPHLGSVSGVARAVGTLGQLRSVLVFIAAASLLPPSAMAADTLVLRRGFLKKVPCEGRLLATGIGDESIVDLEALPAGIGCGVILKPLRAGTTNMILESSTGTVERTISVQGIGITAAKAKRAVKP